VVEGRAVDQRQAAQNLLDDRYVSSGPSLSDTAVRIKGSDGDLCGDRVGGAIEIIGEPVLRVLGQRWISESIADS
jgi:hypothetical protein